MERLSHAANMSHHANDIKHLECDRSVAVCGVIAALGELSNDINGLAASLSYINVRDVRSKNLAKSKSN